MAYRGGQRERVAPGGTSEGAHFRKKCENLRKNVKIYVKKGKFFGKSGQKSRKLGAAQANGGGRGGGTIRNVTFSFFG